MTLNNREMGTKWVVKGGDGGTGNCSADSIRSWPELLEGFYQISALRLFHNECAKVEMTGLLNVDGTGLCVRRKKGN